MINLKPDDPIVETLINITEEAGFRPYFNYSGRGMYGSKCFGIVGKESKLPRFFIAVGREVEYQDNHGNDFGKYAFNDVVEKALVSFNSDAIGMDRIFYFENLDIASPSQS